MSGGWLYRGVVGFLFAATTALLVVCIIGCSSVTPVIDETYFLKIDTSNILPTSLPHAALFQTIAETLGLHDYYQVGLWGYCAGYVDTGVDTCSKPVAAYGFNPVEAIREEMFAGSSFQIPQEIVQYLDLVQKISIVMFVLYIVAVVTSFLTFCIVIWRIRWWTSVLAGFAGICTTLASGVAMAMFDIIRLKLSAAIPMVNIVPSLGLQMFALTWAATLAGLLGMICIWVENCCLAKRRRKRKRLMWEKDRV